MTYNGKEIVSTESEGYNADSRCGEWRKRELLRADDGSVYSVIVKPVFALPSGVSVAWGDNPLVKHFMGVEALPSAAVYGGYVSGGEAAGTSLEPETGVTAALVAFTFYYPPGSDQIMLTADNIPLLKIEGLPADKRRAVVTILAGQTSADMGYA
ncbi:hypothetical protein FACS1894211_04350 [Clostridia bacterium]|nr:hypothetical protein FACS1894211_04350 [Clostridia bacterium]